MISTRFNSSCSRGALLGLGLSAACAVLIAPSAAQPPDRTRQQMELLGGCRDCHECDDPTESTRCLRTCTRAEIARMRHEFESRRGPRVVILDELERLYLPVPFDHEGHANMAAMAGGCGTCHHFTPEGLEHPACKTCHDPALGSGDIAKPGLKGAYHRQCMSCHREWSGETGCNACHRPKAGAAAKGGLAVPPTPDDLIGRMHPPIAEPAEELYSTVSEDGKRSNVLFRHRQHIHAYGLRCAECHREDGCNRCHGEHKEHVQQVRTFEQHHKPCLDCHRNNTCEGCHFDPAASAPAVFNHDRTGWPLTRYHTDKGCRSCHSSVPFGRLERACDSCHVNWAPVNFDHKVTGQALDDNHQKIDCVDCHRERAFDKPPACDECHEDDDGVKFPERRPGPWPSR